MSACPLGVYPLSVNAVNGPWRATQLVLKQRPSSYVNISAMGGALRHHTQLHLLQYLAFLEVLSYTCQNWVSL